MSNMNPTIEQPNLPIPTTEGVTAVPTAEKMEIPKEISPDVNNTAPTLEESSPETRSDIPVEGKATYVLSAGSELKPSGSNSLSDTAIQAILNKIANKNPELN